MSNLDKEASNFAKLWYSYNTCWYEINKEMTDFVNNAFNVDIYLYNIDLSVLSLPEREQMMLNSKKYSNFSFNKPYEFSYWENITNAVSTKFPNYDYSPCEEAAIIEDDYMYDEWLRNNMWFGTIQDMTDFALQLHMDMVNIGIDPRLKNKKNTTKRSINR